MDPIKDIILDGLNDIKPRNTNIEFVSTVTGEPLDGKMFGC